VTLALNRLDTAVSSGFKVDRLDLWQRLESDFVRDRLLSLFGFFLRCLVFFNLLLPCFLLVLDSGLQLGLVLVFDLLAVALHLITFQLFALFIIFEVLANVPGFLERIHRNDAQIVAY
jgi:hypothetical protein